MKWLTLPPMDVFLDIYADDVLIETSTATSDDLPFKLQRCVNNIYISGISGIS